MKMELYILQFPIFIYAHKLPTSALNVFYNDFRHHYMVMYTLSLKFVLIIYNILVLYSM